MHCVLADVNPAALEQAVHALGPQASAQVVDLTSEAAREGLVRAVQQQAGWAGPLATLMLSAPWAEDTLDAADWVLPKVLRVSTSASCCSLARAGRPG